MAKNVADCRDRGLQPYLGFEEPDEWGQDGDPWQGYIYADEVHQFEFSFDASFEYFRVWPLFHVPTSLREELEPY